MILQFKDKLPVAKLNTRCDTTIENLEYIAKFHQLERLTIDAPQKPNSQDLRKFLGGVPLNKLAILGENPISSFPRSLQILNIYAYDSTLCRTTWMATCNLKGLKELCIVCLDVEQSDGPPCHFESSNPPIAFPKYGS